MLLLVMISLHKKKMKKNMDKMGKALFEILRMSYITKQQIFQRYVDVHSMSVSQSCLCSFLCNPYITLQIS